MGTLIYEANVRAQIDDRALTHIQLVVTSKLRRGERFSFTWLEDMSVGGGRTSVWLSPHSSLVYKHNGSRQPSINRYRIEALAFTANSPSGLYLVPEPAQASASEGRMTMTLT